MREESWLRKLRRYRVTGRIGMIEISRRSWKRLTNESKKTPPKRNFFCKLFRRYGLSDYCLKELVEAALGVGGFLSLSPHTGSRRSFPASSTHNSQCNTALPVSVDSTAKDTCVYRKFDSA